MQATRPVRHDTLKCLKRDWRLYMFLLIPLAYIIIFHYVPMLGIQIAFKKYNVAGGIWGSPWVGFKHFEKFFKSYQFERVLTNTLRLSVYSLLFGFPFPIIFALLTNTLNSARFKKVSQTIVNLPHFISVVVLVSMINQVFGSRTGLYGIIGQALTGSYPPDLFANAENFQHLYIWSGVWQNFGWSAIIYIAALTGVSPDLHEAAQIDGASRLQRVIHIDFPSILPTIVIMLIMRCGSILSVGFEKVYLLQNPLNLDASEIISTYTYELGLLGGQYSYSTAIGLFNTLVNVTLLIIVNTVSKKLSDTSLW